LPQSATRVQATYSASIVFNKDSREVRWFVDEDNKSVDRARSSPVGLAFFKLLGKVNWTRNTGGKVIYSDEYMQDEMMSGGDATRVSSRYGPLGEDRPVFRAKARRATKPKMKI
jgi:hypothetical protein